MREGSGVELRVHGVGGPLPQTVLGCAPSDPAVPTWRSQPHARTAVRRSPIDARVVAYDWRPLTSGSKAFALWPVLLPFCLVNVAGWMHPAARSRSPGAAVVGFGRVVSVLIGYTATVSTVVWVLFAGQVLTHDAQALDQAVLARLPGSAAATSFWLGIAGTALALIVIVVASVHVGAGFDRFRPDPEAPHPPRWRLWSSRMPDLRDESFFDTQRDHRWRWRTHATIAGLTAVAVVVVMITGDPGVDDPFESLGDVLVVVGVAQGSLLTLSVLLSVRSPGWWMFAGPAAATIGIMLIGGLTLSALMLVVDVDALPAGPALMVFDVFGLAIGAGVLVAIAFAVGRLVFRRHGGEAPGAAFLRSGEARRRARLARLSTDVGAIATGVGMTFLVAGGIVFVARYQRDDRDLWRLTPNPLVDLGRASLLAVLTFMVLNVVKARANPDSLRRVGTVWDVLTFWPRTFHPFAIRPYSERAVPELRHLLVREGWSKGLQVTAHSQGSVLVYAALLPRAADSRSGTTTSSPLPVDVGLVTFGSPLRTLYTRAFPNYIDPQSFLLIQRLLNGRWVNVFRYTDHIGRAVFVGDGDILGPSDVALEDPAPGGGGVAGHNDYWSTPCVRTVVDEWSGAAPLPPPASAPTAPLPPGVA